MIRTWLQASRLLSQANIAVPLIFGQALAFAYTGCFSWRMLGWIHLYGLLIQISIVYANDAVDHETDRSNQTFNQFSGGSRVVPEGKLQPRALLRGASISLIMLILVGILLTAFEHRDEIWKMMLCALAIFWAYNFPPLRLSYRGYGEILQGIGIGIILPITGFYLQTGSYAFPWMTLLPSFLLGVASHILTSLPDYPSDKKSQKRSYAVRCGPRVARKHIVYLLLIAAFISPLLLSFQFWIFPICSIISTLFCIRMSLYYFSNADAENKLECRKFIFWNGVAITFLLTFWSIGLIV